MTTTTSDKDTASPDISIAYENGVLRVRHLKTSKLPKFTRIRTVQEEDADSEYRMSYYRITGV